MIGTDKLCSFELAPVVTLFFISRFFHLEAVHSTIFPAKGLYRIFQLEPILQGLRVGEENRNLVDFRNGVKF